METVASVVAFVTLTLATVKSCRDLLSAVKDGPEKLDHVTTAISTLVSTFEEIETAPELATLLSSTSLRAVTENCKADFERFRSRLEKIKALPEERQCGKLWKRLKLAFSEKDLPWILVVVNSHVDAVTMELNIIQFRSLDRVEEITNRILAQQEIYSLRIEEQSTTLQAAHNHASDAAEHGAHVRDAVEALIQKVAGMSSASQKQASIMSEMLLRVEKELKRTTATSANGSVESQPNRPPIHSTSTSPTSYSSENSALDQSIGRLSELVTNVECALESADAMDIINDLDTLLRIAARWNRHTESSSSLDVAQQLKPGLDLNELRGQFLKAKELLLNKALSRTTVSGFSITGQNHSYAEYKSTDGRLRIRRHSRVLGRSSPEMTTFSEETNIATWMPENLDVPIALTISYYERVAAGMVSSLPPSLIVSPVLGLKHPVFEAVQNGTVDDLRRLLSERKAWLRARDPYGAPLLHYALGNANIVQFLIMNGADVDDLADASVMDWAKGILISPLHLSVWGGRDNSACFKQLLAAGADPFLPAGVVFDGGDERTPWIGTAIKSAVLTTDYTYMKAAADEIANSCDAFGLLAAGPELLHYSTYNFHSGNMRVLMDQGTDINAKNSDGNNCLFTLLDHASDRIPPSSRAGAEFLESVKFLIETGIDMGPNASGLTPGVYAYHLALNSRFSSCIGDSWDRALAICGIDVAESRIGHPRVGRYKHECDVWVRDTLDLFKSLWDGHENLCPYYEEAVADSTACASQTIDWSRVCTDEACPYYNEMREGPDHWASDDSFSSSSEDFSEDGGVIIDSTALDPSEDSELLQDGS